MRVSLRSFLLALLFAALFTIGCGTKLTKETYEKLEMGMEYEEVVALLGTPATCKTVVGTRHCTWGDDTRQIRVTLLGNRVIFLSSKGLSS